MVGQWKLAAAAAAVLVAGPTGADMMPVAVYVAAAGGTVPAEFAALVWAPVILLALVFAAALLWLIRADHRDATAPHAPRRAAHGGRAASAPVARFAR